MQARPTFVVVSLGAVSSLIAGLFFTNWFALSLEAGLGSMKLGITLRAINMCLPGGACVSQSFTHLTGMYPTAAMGTLVFGALFLVMVAWHAFVGITGAMDLESWQSRAYLLGVGTMGLVLATFFLFGPDVSNQAMMGLRVARGAGGWLSILGTAMGIATIYMTTQRDDALYQAPVILAPPPPGLAHQRAAPSAAPAQVTPPEPEPTPVSAPVNNFDQLRNKLPFVVAVAELSPAGIDARLESGETRLVLWRDVQRVAARQLPATLEAAPCVDLVAGDAVLRLMPFSRLGSTLPTQPLERARELVRRARAASESAACDKQTAAFGEGQSVAPPQLASEADFDRYNQALSDAAHAVTS